MRKLVLLVPAALVVAACERASPAPSNMEIQQPPATHVPASPEPVDPSLINPRVLDTRNYAFPRLLGLDAIAPVYEPQFVAASESPLRDEELIIGVSLEEEAKAYPISVLRFREMVNDELGELPILVTW